MTQRDLPGDVASGLEVAVKVLKGVEDIAMIRLSSLDIVRHPLVQKIVNAYEEYDARMEKLKKAGNRSFEGRDGVRHAARETREGGGLLDKPGAHGRPEHGGKRRKT